MQADPGRHARRLAPRRAPRGSDRSRPGRARPGSGSMRAHSIDRRWWVRPSDGEQREVLGMTGGEPVAVARDRRLAGALPVPPVRRGRRALALRRRRPRAPHEPVRPAHHVSRNCVDLGQAAPATPARPLAADGCGSTAARAERRGSVTRAFGPAPMGSTISSSGVHHECRRSHLACESHSRRSFDHDSRSLAAFSGDVVRRNSSANDSQSSADASGMNRDAKNRRNAGVVPAPAESHHLELHVRLADLLLGLGSCEPALGSRHRPASGG